MRQLFQNRTNHRNEKIGDEYTESRGGFNASSER